MTNAGSALSDAEGDTFPLSFAQQQSLLRLNQRLLAIQECAKQLSAFVKTQVASAGW
jgi:hypothetical protein